MPELVIEKLQYKVIIPKVPRHSHAMMTLRHKTGVTSIKADEVFGTITITVPLFFEGVIGVRLFRPANPVKEDLEWKWSDDKPNFMDYTFHTDIFVNKRHVMDGHAFIDCKKMKRNKTFEQHTRRERKKLKKDGSAFSKIHRKIQQRWQNDMRHD